MGKIPWELEGSPRNAALGLQANLLPALQSLCLALSWNCQGETSGGLWLGVFRQGGEFLPRDVLGEGSKQPPGLPADSNCQPAFVPAEINEELQRAREEWEAVEEIQSGMAEASSTRVRGAVTELDRKGLGRGRDLGPRGREQVGVQLGGIFGEGGELGKGLKVWRGREGTGDPLPSPSSPVLCPPAMLEAGSELPTLEGPLWPEVGACFSTGKPEQRAGLMLLGGANAVLCPPSGLGGTSAGAAAPISFNEALQYFQTADLSECRVWAGPRALALSRGVVLVSRRGECVGRSAALPSCLSTFPLPSLGLALCVILAHPRVSLLPDSLRDQPRSFLCMSSPPQKKVRATVRRQGLAALLHLLFGPPRLQPQLQGERELALAMAQCECPQHEPLARPVSPLS